MSSSALDVQRARRARGMLSDDAVGWLCHRTLAALLASGRPLTESAARAEVDNQLSATVASVYRQSLRQRVVSAVVRYGENFARPGWRFVGAEQITGDVAFDLIWLAADGTLEADEIKTGADAERQLTRTLKQAQAQLAEGRLRYGSRFTAVRIVLLAANRALRVDHEHPEGLPWKR